MIDRADVYCNLFVDTDLDSTQLASVLAGLFSGNVDDLGNFTTKLGDVSVTENDDYNEITKNDEDDGFLFYRYLLEVEPEINLGVNNAIQFVSRILEYLWSQGYSATAACSYEDELPNKGKLVPTNHN